MSLRQIFCSSSLAKCSDMWVREVFIFEAVAFFAARPCQVHSSFHGGKVKGLGQRPTPFNGQNESFFRFPVGISREKGHSSVPFRPEHFANRELTALWYNPSG